MPSRFSILAAGLAIFSLNCAFAEETPFLRDLTVDQLAAYKAGSPKQSSLQVTANVDRRDLTYARGDVLKLRLKTNEDAYVTVFNVGPKGKVTQLFPNSFQKDNLIKANREVEIPSSDSKAEIKIAGDLGGEVIKVFASNKPLKVTTGGVLISGQIFAVVKGGVPELVRDLEVVTSAPAAATEKFSVFSLAIKTVASR